MSEIRVCGTAGSHFCYDSGNGDVTDVQHELKELVANNTKTGHEYMAISTNSKSWTIYPTWDRIYTGICFYTGTIYLHWDIYLHLNMNLNWDIQCTTVLLNVH